MGLLDKFIKKQPPVTENGRFIHTTDNHSMPPSAFYDLSRPTDVNTNNYSSREWIPDFPPVDLLHNESTSEDIRDNDTLRVLAFKLEDAYASFGLEVKVVNILKTPSHIRFEISIGKGIRISEIKSLKDNIQLSLAVTSLNIEAPIPGKSLIGIDIPNLEQSPVYLRKIIEDIAFIQSSNTTFVLGQDARIIMFDLRKYNHLFITGANPREFQAIERSIVCSMLYKSTPDTLKLIIIDPLKELSVNYNHIPHLALPVAQDPEKIAAALRWASIELERRFRYMSVNTIKNYDDAFPDGEHIVVFVNSLESIPKESYDIIKQIIASGASAGIHLIVLSTVYFRMHIYQLVNDRISNKVVFAVNSKDQSESLIHHEGAAALTGFGNFIFYDGINNTRSNGTCPIVSLEDMHSVISFLEKKYAQNESNNDAPEDSDLLDQAVKTIIDAGNASVSILQRRLGLGYPRAARLIDFLEQNHIIGPFEGSKPRKVLITQEEWERMKYAQNKSNIDVLEDSDLLDQAVKTIIDAGNASVLILQRRLGIGYPRAARLIDVLEQNHIIGPFEGSKPRKVLITQEEWQRMKQT